MSAQRHRWFRILLVLVALYALVGFLVVPPIARSQLEDRLSRLLGRRVTIERVRVNPFAMSAALDRLQVRMPDGQTPFLGWTSLYVNFDPLKLFTGEAVLGQVALDGLHASAQVNADGSLSFADVLQRFSARAPAPRREERPWLRWRIARLAVTDARVEFLDRSRSEAFQTVVGPVNFTLLDFHPKGGAGAPYRFDAVTESGEKVNWTGTLTAAPLSSAGEFRVENLSLPKYAPYFEDRVNVLVTAGKLNLHGQYDVSFAPGERRLLLKEGAVALRNLKLIERRNAQPLAELPRIEASGIAADGAARRLSVKSVQVEGGRLTLRRDRDGTLNVAAVGSSPTPAAGTASAATPEPEQRLGFTAGEVAVRDLQVDIHDLATPRPVEAQLTRVNATVKDVTLTPGAALPVEVIFGWAPQGTVHLAGQVTLDPLRTDLAVELAWLPLAPLSPYFEQAVRARVMGGALSAKGRAVATFGPGAPEVLFAGNGRVEDLAVVDGDRGEPLAGFADLTLGDLKASTAPRLALSVNEVSMRAPYLRLRRNADEKLNVAELVPASPAASAAAVALPTVGDQPGATAAARPDVTIGRVVVDSGELSFTDQSVDPVVQLAVSKIALTLKDLAAARPEGGNLELQAVVGGTGLVTAVGRLNPFAGGGVADLKVTSHAIDLKPVDPYVGKYAGYHLERGALLFDTQARLVQQKLEMQNRVTLDQFTLGQPTNSPDALKLPVRLGVALLKDASGKIVVDIPVAGSLADPQFHASHVASRVITNLLAKAATSPFALLGSMFGGGGEELGQQVFPAGETALTPESRRRLATVARALAARPALTVEMVGGFDPDADPYELKRARLEDMIRRGVWTKLRATTADLPPVDKLLVSDRDRADMITQLYQETIARGAPAMASEAARALPPPPPAAAEPRPASPPESAPAVSPASAAPAEHRGIFRRAWDVATLKPLRDWRSERKARAEAEENARHEAELAEAKRRAAEEAARAVPPPQLAAAARAADVPRNEMIARLIDAMPVGSQDLQALAQARAERVRQTLIDDGKIAPERLIVVDDAGRRSAVRAARVDLQLR